MAVPVIANIYPVNGPVGGGSMIRILGLNFRVPDEPAATGPVPAPLPSVEVAFDGVPAERVVIVGDSLLYVTVPTSPLSDPVTGNGSGSVDVRIRNLDNAGDPIPGEEVTAADGFGYVQLDLTETSELTRLTEALILEMRRQLIDEVVLSQHTDYDGSTGDSLDIVETSKLPAVVLIGPEIVENRFFSLNGRETVDAGDGTVLVRQPGLTVDLQFTVLGIANHRRTLLNLQAATLQFFHRNKVVRMLCDPNNPGLGYVEYEMQLEEGNEPSVREQANESNVLAFTGRFEIRGLDINGQAGFTDPAAGGVVFDRTVPVGEAGVVFDVEQSSDC